MNGSEKILLIVSEFPPGPGGIGNHAYNLAKYLLKNSIEVKVMTVSDYAEKSESENFDSRQEFEIIRFERYKSRIKTSIERFKQIKKIISENDFTHIIFSGRFSLFCSAFLSKEKTKAKFISIVHGGDINSESIIQTILINKALSKSELVIAVSNFSKSFIKIKSDSMKVEVIPNGFDTEITQVNLNIKTLPEKGVLNLITVGTLWPRKGHHNVLKAIPSLSKSYQDLNYTIIGRQADLSRVNLLLENKEIKNRVKLTGQISDTEKENELKRNNIFILLSETQAGGDFEGFGIAVIEANHFGLPAIGSKNSGLEDSIKDGVSGILVDPKNVKEITDAVNTIMNNYDKFSKGAMEWASEHHWSKIIKRYISAIDSIY